MTKRANRSPCGIAVCSVLATTASSIWRTDGRSPARRAGRCRALLWKTAAVTFTPRAWRRGPYEACLPTGPAGDHHQRHALPGAGPGDLAALAADRDHERLSRRRSGGRLAGRRGGPRPLRPGEGADVVCTM